MSFPLVKNTSDTRRGPSPSIFAGFRDADYGRDPNMGVCAFSDFAGGSGGFSSFEDTTSTVVTLDNHPGGAVRLYSGSTDDDGVSLYYGGPPDELGVPASGTGPFIISSTASSQYALGFEARIKIDSLTDDVAGIFVGLAAQSICVTSPGVVAADVIADEAAIGWFRDEDNGDDMDFVYNEAGQAQNDHDLNVFSTGGGALSAIPVNTWIKLGFLFQPNWVSRADGTNQDRIVFFINGEPYRAAAAVIDQADLEAATFPDDAGMTPVVSVGNEGTVGINVDVDWIKCCQELVN